MFKQVTSMNDNAASVLFSRAFGRQPTVVSAAPGRVNLIGEHTDYHQGFVLPTVIPQRTTVAMRVRGDEHVRVVSETMADGVRGYWIGAERRGGNWLDYVQGVTAVAGTAGFPLQGFDAAITSTLPAGGGVSSSAALTVALLRALRDTKLTSMDDVQIAQMAQRAETEFVGAPVGIMDQMACSLGRDREALFIDTRSLEYQRLPLPVDAELIVINSGITHAHADGEYRQRRNESFAAAKELGVRYLRDAGGRERCLTGKTVGQRRARHVITENARVLEAVTAIRERDVARLGGLFSTSHRSQRDDYETSTPEIDALIEIGERDPGVYGARLTGGGFGGSVVMLAKPDSAAAAAARILDEYQRLIGCGGSILLPMPVPHKKEAIQCA